MGILSHTTCIIHNTKCKNSDNCYKGEKPSKTINDAKKSEQQKRKGTETKGTNRDLNGVVIFATIIRQWPGYVQRSISMTPQCHRVSGGLPSERAFKHYDDLGEEIVNDSMTVTISHRISARLPCYSDIDSRLPKLKNFRLQYSFFRYELWVNDTTSMKPNDGVISAVTLVLGMICLPISLWQVRNNQCYTNQ